MQLVTIRNSVMRREDLPDTLESFQAVVGGFIEQLFSVRSRVQSGFITCFINDDAWMRKPALPVTFSVRWPNLVVDVRGDAVFTGSDRGGNPRALSVPECVLLETAYNGVSSSYMTDLTPTEVILPGVLNMEGLR